MALCILAGGKTAILAVTTFTLSWTHSVEKTRWEEDWRLTPAGLVLVQARLKGSGAGMEPPAAAVFKHGWWVYVPDIPPRPEILLAASGATGAGWTVCGGATCIEIGEEAGEPARLRACRPDEY
jgi:hypothetical protein